MNWLTDNIQVLFAIYIHKLEQVSPLVVFKLTLIAGCVVTGIAGFWGGMAPLILSWVEDWVRRREKERKAGK